MKCKDKSKGKNRPHWASRYNNQQSFCQTQPSHKIWENNFYFLNRQIGFIRFTHRDYPRWSLEHLHHWVLKRQNGKYYLILVFFIDIAKLPKTTGMVGIDVGVKHFITTDNGKIYDYPKDILEKYKCEKRRIQRSQAHKCEAAQCRAKKLARRKVQKENIKKQKTYSKNYLKGKLKYQKICAKISNIRNNVQHKITHDIVNHNQFIATETLKPSNMIKNHHLARVIQNAGFSSFQQKLAYKCAWYARTLKQVDPFYPSSQICHHCGYQYHELKLSERSWVCPKCGNKHDRDVNAAKNILKESCRSAAGESLACIKEASEINFLSMPCSQEPQKRGASGTISTTQKMIY